MEDKVYVVVKNTTFGFPVGTTCKKVGGVGRIVEFELVPLTQGRSKMYHPMSDVEEFVPAPIEDFL